MDNGFLMRLQVMYSLLLVFHPFFFTYMEIIEVRECWNNGFNVTEAHPVRYSGSSLTTTVYRYLSEV